MHYILIAVVTAVTLVFGAIPASSAQIDWEVVQKLTFAHEPLDLLVNQRARRVYILNDQGEILVYGFNGQLKGKLDVGRDVLQIRPGPNEEMVFLVKKASKAVEAIRISIVETIDVTGSPFKGDVNAPVTIAVFSDFQ